MSDLCDFEIEVLESLAGLRPPITWGADLSATLGFLKGFGYVEKAVGARGIEYRISEKGMTYLLNKDSK